MKVTQGHTANRQAFLRSVVTTSLSTVLHTVVVRVVVTTEYRPLIESDIWPSKQRQL